jgi:hypothetical protein
VIELYKLGTHPDQIATHFGCPITPEQAYAIPAYYHRNKEAVEAYMERGKVIAEAHMKASQLQGPSEAVKRIKAIKAARANADAERPA